MKYTNHFCDRLAISMKEAGYEPKPAVLEREFNLRYWGRSITLQGVRRWLRGEAVPSDDKMECLATWLKVDKNYLRFGEEAASAITKQAVQLESKLNPAEREMIDQYTELPLDKKRIVRDIIAAFYLNLKNDKT